MHQMIQLKKIIMGKPRGNRLDYFTAVLVIAMVAKNEEEFVRYMAMSGNELFKKIIKIQICKC